MLSESSTMLQHLVFHKLSEGPRSGYALCSEIERETGKRPSYGSIYPLLEKLQHAGDVTVRADGRKKIYTLTVKGKEMIESTSHCRQQFIEQEKARIKQLMTLMDMDPAPLVVMLERTKKGDPPLGKITGPMFDVRDLVFRMAADGRADRNATEINRLLAELRKRLEKMR